MRGTRDGRAGSQGCGARRRSRVLAIAVSSALLVCALMLPATSGTAAPARCDWPSWGNGPARNFVTDCGELDATNATQLRRIWFFNTHDVVTATPAVVGDTAYVGDWSGRFYALRVSNGKPRWQFQAKPQRNVYAGQIVSSAAVTTVNGTQTVFFGSGRILYALRASDGALRWKHRLGNPGDANDPTEIESSPIVVDGTVYVGWDVHNSGSGEPAGVLALDAATGREKWRAVTAPTEGDGATGAGCGDVWSSPAVDSVSGLLFVGTGNCVTSPKGWGRFSEAIVALGLADGAVRWTYQPHEPNRDDLDYAGAPNLFEVAGRPVVGLGNKDGSYYAVDRATGALVWSMNVAAPGLTHPGGNFSTGGFIGPTAVAGGIVTGGTAIGGAPYLHGLDANTGAIRWQQPVTAATYGAPAVANDVVVIGGTDFTLRAISLASGNVVWSDEVSGAVSGGAAIVGPDVIAVAGIREPGGNKRSTTSGVYRYSLRGKALPSASRTPKRPKTPATQPPETERTGPATAQACVGSPCDVAFDLIQPPAGLSPHMTLQIALDPWHVEVHANGLGDPSAWLRPGSPQAATGATRFGVFISESDDNPQGGLLCVLDASGSCTTSKIPRTGASYNRITILAIGDSNKLPSPAEGVNRLVVTKGFSPALIPASK
jgi:polyvinyl alcohol dehydrogenase (cytochrome)